MLKSYFVIRCACKLSMDRFDSMSSKYNNYPTDTEIEACIENLEKQGFEVSHARVEKHYQKGGENNGI